MKDRLAEVPKELRKDILNYSAQADERAIAAILAYCGTALRSADGARVSLADPQELTAIREGFAARKLHLAPGAANAGIDAAARKMKAAPRKSRVTFYYLLAESTGTLGRLT